MPLSNYSVPLTVEIAFNAGFLTPAASYVWTDVSDYVEGDQGVTITVGRGDERSTADANQLTLTLINSDGRFTAGRAASPYYPNVKLNRPIRVTATPVDGGASVRFVGFINEWPTEWSDGTDATAYATVTASSRLSRLGYVAALKSIVEQTILADSSAAYYTLGEAAGATQANDSSGRGLAPLRLDGNAALPVVFGTATGPGTDSLTAAQFQGGQYLRGASISPASTSLTIEFAFLVPAAPSSESYLLSMLAYEAVSGFAVSMTTSGGLQMRDFTGAGAVGSVTTTSYADNATHWASLDIAGNNWTLYVDGTSVATGLGTSPATGFTYEIRLGRHNDASPGLSGVLAHYAVFQGSLTTTQRDAHRAAALTGFAGDTTSARLARYASYMGIPAAEVSTETGQTTVQHIDTTGKQAVELMRVMEDTEGGVLFDNRDGVLTFHNRAHRLTESALFTLDMAQHQVEAGYAPKLDRSALANDITATDVSGQFSAHKIDSTSITDNGYAAMSIETASEDDDEPLFQASWALYKYKQPLPRIPTLGVDPLAQVGKTPNCSTVMSANVGDKITVSNRPTQDSSSSASFFVEGYTEVYGPESLRITFNVSPSSPEDQTLVIGDATRGVIGTNPVAL